MEMVIKIYGTVTKEHVTPTSWYDVKDYGATGNGTTDDTANIQTAINTCINNGGGDIYFPAGQYLTSAALTVNTSAVHVPVYMHGVASAGGNNVNTPGGTTLILSQAPSDTTSTYGVYALGGGNPSGCIFRMTDITMVTATPCTAPSLTYEAVHTQDMMNVYFERVQMFENHDAAGQVTCPAICNAGIRIVNAFGAWIDQCNIQANMNGVWMDSTQQLFLTNSFVSAFTANTNSVCVRVDDATNRNGSGTIQITNVATFGGGYGLYGQTYSGNNINPAFFYVNDMQINNPSQGGIYLASGSQMWLDYAWVSLEHPTNGVAHGINLGPGFEGTFYMVNSVIQSPSGHGVWIQNGTGHAITGSSFGGCSRGNPGSYDDIHVAHNVSNVSITGNHFDVDVAQGINGARCAVYLETGAVNCNITGNIFAESGYHTDTVIDYAGATGAGNSNFVFSHEGWVTIPLDSGWSTGGGCAVPQYRLSPDGNLQFRGRCSAVFSGSKTLNSSHPIADNPEYSCDFYSSDMIGARCHISISPGGVLTAYAPASGTGTWYAEVNGMVPLN